MSISHSKKIILVHIPKTGGQSIHKALGMGTSKKHLYGFHGDEEYSHLTAAGILEKVGRAVFDSCLKIAVVRNPYDRLVSEYHFKKKGDHRFINVNRRSFEQFVTELHSRFSTLKNFPHREINHFLPQADFVCDAGGENLLVDRLFRFEEFDTAIADFIKSAAGVREMPHLNSTSRSGYRSYYTDRTRAMAADMYRTDLEKFNYSF